MDTATHTRINSFLGAQEITFRQQAAEANGFDYPELAHSPERAKAALEASALIEAVRLVLWSNQQLDKHPDVTVNQFRHTMEERLCEILLDASHDQVDVFDLAVQVRFNRLASRFFALPWPSLDGSRPIATAALRSWLKKLAGSSCVFS